MTLEEFRDKVNKLMTEVDPKYDIFVSALDINTGDGQCFGYGCQACHVVKILELAETGFYQHSKKPGIKH